MEAELVERCSVDWLYVNMVFIRLYRTCTIEEYCRKKLVIYYKGLYSLQTFASESIMCFKLLY